MPLDILVISNRTIWCGLNHFLAECIHSRLKYTFVHYQSDNGFPYRSNVFNRAALFILFHYRLDPNRTLHKLKFTCIVEISKIHFPCFFFFDSWTVECVVGDLRSFFFTENFPKSTSHIWRDFFQGLEIGVQFVVAVYKEDCQDGRKGGLG